MRHTDQYCDKLVPSQPRQSVSFAHTGLEPHGNGLEQLVTGPVTEGVVDPFETIQIKNQDAQQILVPGGLGYCKMQAVMQQTAVGKPGQGIIVDELLNFTFGPDACGYVERGA